MLKISHQVIEGPRISEQGEKAAPPKVNDSPAVPKTPRKTGPSVVQTSSSAPVPPHLGYKQASKIPNKAPLRQTQPAVNVKGDQHPREKKKASRRRRKGKKTAPAETQEMGARVAVVRPHLRGKNRKQ